MEIKKSTMNKKGPMLSKALAQVCICISIF